MTDSKIIKDAFNRARSEKLPPFKPIDRKIRTALVEIADNIQDATKKSVFVRREGEREFLLGINFNTHGGWVKFWLGNGPGINEIPVYLGPEKDPKTNQNWAHPNIDCIRIGDITSTDKTGLIVELIKRAGNDHAIARRAVDIRL